MARFRYAIDPLCVVGSLAYGLNRWFLKARFPGGFLQGHFNDLWLIPCALPPLLWIHRRLGFRAHDGVPTLAEIGIHLAVWSVVCEWIGPRVIPHATADPVDVAMYSIGAVLAGAWWNRRPGTATPDCDPG